MLVAVASFLGTVVGTLRDPMVWGMVAICAVMGLKRAWMLWVPVVAAIATGLTVSTIFSWWQERGIADQWLARTFHIFVVQMFIAIFAYGAGLLLAMTLDVSNRAND